MSSALSMSERRTREKEKPAIKTRTGFLEESQSIDLYEQIDVGISREIHPGGSAAYFNTIHKLVLLVSEQIHGHLAGDKLNAAFLGKVKELPD